MRGAESDKVLMYKVPINFTHAQNNMYAKSYRSSANNAVLNHHHKFNGSHV